MIFEIDDIIPFVNRTEHVNHTIRQIIRYDSGYLKDLFINDNTESAFQRSVLQNCYD